jgi:hypothetical protein
MIRLDGEMRELTLLEKAEVLFLEEIRNRGGLTIKEMLSINNPDINFGTGIDAIDIVNKFTNLGFLEYQPDTAKFTAIKL